MNSDKEKMLNELLSYARDNYIPVIRDESLKELLHYCKDADRILEVGTAIGYSASHMALNSNAVIDTVEIDSERYEMAKQVINALNIESRINLYLGDADKLLESITKAKKYSLIFLDGAKTGYCRQVYSLLDNLQTDGVIFVDNVNSLGYVMSELPLWEVPRKHRASVRSLREFLMKILGDKNLSVTLKKDNDGIAVIRKV